MEMFAKVLIGLLAFEHLYIMWLEMFAWDTRGRKVFRGAMPDHLFAETKGLAANQGLYNGFLAAGLIWSLVITDSDWSRNVALFFLVCVASAGTYAGITTSRKIFYVQAVPAILTILALLFV
jgi:putative membrane protein